MRGYEKKVDEQKTYENILEEKKEQIPLNISLFH